MARKRSKALTDAEAKVMAVIWRRQAATVGEVVTTLRKGRGATYSTIQTILRILESKGYVTHDKVDRAFVYRPLVDEHQARRRALKQLLARLFNGSPSLLVSNVLDDEDIDPAELEQLKNLIKDA